VLVNVEHAPKLRVADALAPLLVRSILPPGGDGMLHQAERATVKRIDSDDDFRYLRYQQFKY